VERRNLMRPLDTLFKGQWQIEEHCIEAERAEIVIPGT